MSDSFSFPEKEQLCQKNTETVKAKSSETERTSGQKVLQDVPGHRNIRTAMGTYAKAFRDKKVEAVRALNGAFKIS